MEKYKKTKGDNGKMICKVVMLTSGYKTVQFIVIMHNRMHKNDACLHVMHECLHNAIDNIYRKVCRKIAFG